MKTETVYNGKIISNDVHKQGSILVEIEKVIPSWIYRLLGKKYQYELPVEVDEAAEWREGDEIKIKVENTTRKDED